MYCICSNNQHKYKHFYLISVLCCAALQWSLFYNLTVHKTNIYSTYQGIIKNKNIQEERKAQVTLEEIEKSVTM